MRVEAAGELGTAGMSGEGSAGGPPRALLQRARLGDREAFGRLFETLGADVERLCVRLLGGRDEAQDARNEVFLRAQTAFAGYDPGRPFRTWLLSVAAHHCVDRLRRRKRESALFAPDDGEAGERADGGPSPLAAALRAEDHRRLLSAIDELEPRYRVPLVLRHFAELSYAEIAEVVQVGPAQVGTLLHRARRRLRERLAGAGGRP